MYFLHLLEQIRTPVLNNIMLFLTRGGEEIVFIVTAMIFLWCINKNSAYMLLLVGLTGNNINQVLKVSFRVLRPWVLDPTLNPVQSAIPAATGYSFPSGHTQSAVGTFGTVALTLKNRFFKVAAISLAVLVAFSRMYLGVHTPKDVIVSVLVATALITVYYFIFKLINQNQKGMCILFLAVIALFIAQIIFLSVYLKGSNDELISGLKNAYKMLGAVCGLLLSYLLDKKYINFETKAPLLVQIIKVLLGLCATLAVKEICYFVFSFIKFAPLSRGISYFIMVVFAGAVWPLTFPIIKNLLTPKTMAKN